MASAAFEKRNPLKKEDITCPICWSVLIEPVTLPCKHNLCLVCFHKHVNETALACPCCRKRLSVWSRKACKENKLVNLVYWERIQREFPKLVYARLNNEDSQDLGADATISTEEINDDGDGRGESFMELDMLLAAPPPKRDGECATEGEIRQEFENLYKHHLEDLEIQRKQEAEASSEFIRKIQEEETQKEAEELSKLEADREYAKRLQMEEESKLQTRALVNKRTSLLEKDTLVKKPLCRNLLSEWGPSLTSPAANISPSTEKKTSSQLSNSSRTPSSSGSLKRRSSSSSNHSNKSKNLKRTEKSSSQSSILNFFTNSQDLDDSRSARSISPQPSTSASAMAALNSSKNSTSSFVVVGCNSSGNIASPFKPILASPKCNLDMSTSKFSPVKSLNINHPTVTFAEQPNIPSGKGTPDSIHVEFNSHFRPIRSAPKTPPKRLADGTYLPEPKIVKTTPIRPSPKTVTAVIAPIHNNSSFGNEGEESYEEIQNTSTDSTSVVPCPIDTDNECNDTYTSLQSTLVEVEPIFDTKGTFNNSTDDKLNCSLISDSKGLEIPLSCAKLNPFSDSSLGIIPESPMTNFCEEAVILQRYRKRKEQEKEDFKLALALQNEYNKKPSPIARNKASKERYSIRNWLKPKGVSQNTSAVVSKTRVKASNIKDKKSPVKAKATPVSTATITIRSASTPKKESEINGNGSVASPLANIVNSNSINNNLSPYTRELRSNCKL